MSVILSTIESLKAILQQKQQALADAEAEYNKANAAAAEYQRQSEYHASRGDYTNSAITDRRRDDELIKKAAAQKLVEAAQAAYDAALKNLNDALKNLSEDQKAAVKSDMSLKEKEVDAKSKEADALKAAVTFAAKNKTTLYLIVGLVALAAIAVGVFFLRKKYAA